MQNTSIAHSVRLGIVIAVLTGILMASLLVIAPSQAFAKEYEMSHVNMGINVQDNGNVQFTEARQFDFDGSFTCVWWEFGKIAKNASIEINGVSLQEAGADASTARTLKSVPFQTPWRDAGGPGGEAYSYDEEERTLYVFFDVTDESLVVNIDWTVVNGISAYDDMGELYWKYINSGWAVDSEDVTATVTLPVPEGETVSPTENVFAWGHGPINGTVHFNDDGTITYYVDRVSAGTWAEARVLFPVEWMPNLSESSKALHAGETIYDSALADEQKWADEANMERMGARVFLGFWIVLSLGLIIWALVVFFRWGKELRPKFTDTYWRDVPDKELPPAVIGRLMKFNAEDSAQFTATLMNLSAKGVVRIDKGSYADRRGRQVEDYYLTLIPETLDLVEIDTLERKAINLVFGDIAKGENQLWLKSIELYGKSNPEKFAKKMESWQGALTSEVNKANLFEAKSDSLQGTMFFIGIAYFVVGAAVWMFFDNLIQLVPIIPTCIVLLAISHFMSRRTTRGAEVAAKSNALKKWLKEFTRLDERPPTDVKVWGQFMVYAYLFGVAEEAMKNMRMSVPAFRDMDDRTFYSTMPYYYWYSPGFGHHNAIAASVFDATLSNTINTAVAAVSEMSSGGGGGGGFSGGGGGGFGGGGGGGAR